MDVLLFELHNARYAIPAAAIVEIVRAVALVPIAGAPRGVEGVFSLRGRVTPVVDVRERFGLPSTPLDPEQHFVVVALIGRWVALRVDHTVGLVKVDEESLTTSLADLHKTLPTAQHVAGVVTLNDGLVVIYDVGAFLSASEAEALGALVDALPRAAVNQSSGLSSELAPSERTLSEPGESA